MNTQIESLNLSKRALWAMGQLRQFGPGHNYLDKPNPTRLENLEDLVNKFTISDLYRCRNTGRKTVLEIMAVVKKAGLVLRLRIPEPIEPIEPTITLRPIDWQLADPGDDEVVIFGYPLRALDSGLHFIVSKPQRGYWRSTCVTDAEKFTNLPKSLTEEAAKEVCKQHWIKMLTT
jgi:hypothetical protein